VSPPARHVSPPPPPQQGPPAAHATSGNAEPTWSDAGHAYASDADTDVMGSDGRVDVEGEEEWLYGRGVYDSLSDEDYFDLTQDFEMFSM